MRIILIFFYFISPHFLAFAGANPIDNEVSKAKSTSITIEVFNILDSPEKLKSNEDQTAKKPVLADKKAVSLDSIKVYELLNKAKPILQTNYKKAFKLTREALEIAESTKDSELMGKTQNFMGTLYWYSGDYSHASEFYFNALKSYQKTKNEPEIAECYRNIGWIYMGQGKYERSEDYFYKSLEFHTRLGNSKRVIIIYDDLGNLYITSKQYKKGLELCKKAKELALKEGYHEAIGTISTTTAILYYGLKDYQNAQKEFDYALQKLNKLPNQSYNTCLAYSWYAKLKLDQNKYQEALVFSQKAIQLALTNNFLPELAEAYKISSQIYKHLNQHQKAYDLMELYAQTNDSVNALNNRNYIQEMAARMEYEQSKMQIKNLQQERKLTETKLKSEKAYKLFLLIIILCLFLLAFFIFRSFLRKKKDNQIIAKAYHEIELKNKDISDSIEYALHIQQARLPHLQDIQSSFPDLFVLFLPRDVVSGDFYWFTQTESRKHIFAVADCTGHGIPGAFMSMMGIDALNYAILEKHIESPSLILDHVNKFINKSLIQNSNMARSRDGMDAAICIFEPDLSRVKFAGANRPLWIVRDQELIQFLPDKMSIGGNSNSDFEFHEFDIPLKKGDSLFLFSDGFPDQFGGENNKKFMTKNLKKLLIEIAHLPPNEQEVKLYNTLQEWKGAFPQIDDIIIVGINV